MVRKHIKKLALLACTLATVSTANAAWMTGSWAGYAYAQTGQWAENWVSANNHKTWQDNIYWGSVSTCSSSGSGCNVSTPSGIQVQYAEATSISGVANPNLDPSYTNFWNLPIIGNYTNPQSKLVGVGSVTIRAGQSAQPQIYVPRRYGWTTVRGDAYFTGYKDTYCEHGCLTNWQYEWDWNGYVGMLNGYKAQGAPILTYRIT